MTQKLKAILVDDEESARDVLENLLLRFCPDVELICKCSQVTEAVEQIKKHQPDVVFLDIEMPNYAGYEIVRFFDAVNFELIFITAYDSYAIRAFEVAAVDYLLKPVDIDRLKTAVERVCKKVNSGGRDQRMDVLKETLATKKVSNILVSDKGYQYVVAAANIIAIEAEESYCQIYTTEKKYLVSKNLKHFETVLEENHSFFRPHKSWIVNRAHLLNYSRSGSSITMAGDIEAKLSKYRKEAFESWLLHTTIPE